MRSFQHEDLAPQGEDLDRLGRIYEEALKALTQDRIEEVMDLLEEAAPLLDVMQHRDREMRKGGMQYPLQLKERIREVIALHKKLLATCSEERLIAGEACGRLATSRKFLKGYKPHTPSLGRFLDGEG